MSSVAYRIIDSTGTWGSLSTPIMFPPRTECVLCESKIPADRQENRDAYCSDECQRAAAVAEKLAGPEAEVTVVDYGVGYLFNSSMLSTVQWAGVSTVGPSQSWYNLNQP